MALERPKILLVEDEPAQREMLAYNLRAEGYEVVEATDGDDALVLVAEEAPDVLLLDWMIPGTSGIEVCRQLKARSETHELPIIMLSARTEETDRVRGLDIGADDYVAKPYSVAELIARVRSQLRRVSAAKVGHRLECAGVLLDPDRQEVTREGRPVKLGPTEFRLLATLMEKPGRVLSREQLLDRVWGRDIYIDTRTVDVHVARLRKALGSNGDVDLIKTVRGAGYALNVLSPS